MTLALRTVQSFNAAPENGSAPADRLPALALASWRLRRVQDLIDDRLSDRLSLHDLAAAAGLSRMHFAAQFRSATGLSPHEYLLKQRIETAKVLLSDTQTPLAILALDVGFQAQAHFTTVFKRRTGITPAAWRRATWHTVIASNDSHIAGQTRTGHSSAAMTSICCSAM